MQPASKPFEFESFNGKPDPEVTGNPLSEFSNEEHTTEAAQPTAEAIARDELLVKEAQAQSSYLAKIQSLLEDDNAEYHLAFTRLTREFCNAAKLITKAACLSDAVEQQARTAIALLEQYGESVTQERDGALVVSDTTPNYIIETIEQAIYDNGGKFRLTLVQDSDIANGDVRLQWNNGSIATSYAEMMSKINDLFPSIDELNANTKDIEVQP